MHFKNLYPKANIGYKIPEYPEVRKSKYKTNCDFCGAQTRWYDKKSNSYVCCVRCMEYMREENEMG